MKISLKYGYENTQVVQNFETLANVVSMALGGKGKDQDTVVPTSDDELERAMMKVLG